MPNVSQTTPTQKAKLTMSQYVVTVKNGKDIKNVDDAWKKVSPFCRLKVNDKVLTTTVRKDTKSPSWHEVMAFQVESATGSTVELEVLDGSDAAAPTSLGKCAVALDATRKERMVPLMTKNKKGANERAGTVTLGIVFEPATPAAAAAPVSSAGTASPDPAAPLPPAPLPTPAAIAAAERAAIVATPAAAIIDPPKQQQPLSQPVPPATQPIASTAAAAAAASTAATAANGQPAVPASASKAAASNGKATAVPPAPAAAAPITVDPITSDGKLAAVLVGVVVVLMLLMQWLKNPSGSGGLTAGAEPIELVAGSRIMARKSVASSTHYLYMTGDGNLILGPDPKAMLEAPSLWESGTAGPRCNVLFCRAVATRDGRIVVKRGMKDVASFAVAEVEELARHVAIKEKEPSATLPAPEAASS